MPEGLISKVRRISNVIQVSFEIPWEVEASRGSELHTQVSDLAFDWQGFMKEVKSWSRPVFVGEQPTLLKPTSYSVEPGQAFY